MGESSVIFQQMSGRRPVAKQLRRKVALRSVLTRKSTCRKTRLGRDRFVPLTGQAVHRDSAGTCGGWCEGSKVQIQQVQDKRAGQGREAQAQGRAACGRSFEEAARTQKATD